MTVTQVSSVRTTRIATSLCARATVRVGWSWSRAAGSEYDGTGKVVRGPAPKSLRLAHVQVDNDAVLLSDWLDADFRLS